MKNGVMRHITGLILGLMLMFCILFHGGVLIPLMILIVAILSSFEWYGISKTNGSFMRICGFIIIFLPNISLMMIHILYHASNGIVILLLAVCGYDIGGYYAGKLFGRRKLKITHSISPNKSLEGFIGGILFGSIVSIIYVTLSNASNSLIKFCPLIVILALCGDLFESFLKRQCSVKDSGSMLPGHGGILDRVDSFIFASPALLLILMHFL